MARTSALLALAALAAGAHAADQIHLSLTGKPGEMHVAFATTPAATACAVAYGTTPSGLSQSAAGAPPVKFTDGGSIIPIYLCDVTLSGLQPGGQYYYAITSEASRSLLYNFTAAPLPGPDVVRRYAILADFGEVNDVSIGRLREEAAAGAFDVVIHAGDMAYNLQDSAGAVGNAFMNDIQPIAASKPWQATVGNHEADGDTFAQFRARFQGLQGTTSGGPASNSSVYYSFNDGPIHWIALDTEMFTYGGSPAAIAAQTAWLRADLAAVDRSVTPWVIAYGHKQRWMGDVNFTEFEPALLEGHTDLYICGHVHNYQRLAPNAYGTVESSCIVDRDTYRGCKTMATVVVGSPGCREKISKGGAPGDQLVVEFDSYGYGSIEANATALRVSWQQTGTAEDMAAGVRRDLGAAADKDEFLILKA